MLKRAFNQLYDHDDAVAQQLDVNWSARRPWIRSKVNRAVSLPATRQQSSRTDTSDTNPHPLSESVSAVAKESNAISSKQDDRCDDVAADQHLDSSNVNQKDYTVSFIRSIPSCFFNDKL
jgi:hypothetical protein